MEAINKKGRRVTRREDGQNGERTGDAYGRWEQDKNGKKGGWQMGEKEVERKREKRVKETEDERKGGKMEE